jgi:hypothetical protein
MIGFFLPPVVAVVIGVVVLAVGLALHIPVIAGVGVVALAIGGVRYASSRRGKGIER